MSEKKPKKDIIFITCPECGGTGRLANQNDCNNCGGIGLGAFKEGRFYYWDLDISSPAIRLRSLRSIFHYFLSGTAFFVGLVGLACLGVWLWQSSSELDLTTLYFWKYKHPYLMVFWISVLADMFVVYRLSDDAKKSHKLNFRRKKTGREQEGPNNWKELKRSSKRIEVSSGFSQEAIKAVEEAASIALKLRHEKVMPMHLFWTSLKDKYVGAIFSRLNVDGTSLIEKIKSQLSSMPPSTTGRVGDGEVSNELKEVLIGSHIDALSAEQHKVEIVNFLGNCQEKDKDIDEILYALDITKDEVVNSIEWFRINERMFYNYKVYRRMARFKPDSVMDKAYTAVAAPLLTHYSYDLTKQAKWGRLEICVAREKEIGEIFEKFESGHAGVVLVGEPGVGKNTVVGGIAQLMVKEEVPKMIEDKRLIELDVARLVSGADASGAQERLLAIIDEIIRAGNIVLYIKNIETIIGIQAGEGESFDLSEVLVGALERKNFFCIASVNPRNYAKHVEGKPIGHIMSRVDIEEPQGNQAIQILESKIGYLEGKYKVYFSYHAIEETIKLTSRYIHDRYLPLKAIDISESTALAVSRTRGDGSIVTKDDIAKMISRTTDIPVDKVSEKESAQLLNLEEKIHERMIGQEEAIKMVAESLRRARVEIRDQKRPIASFLFMGPTGVGKTELAKTVADVYFGEETAMTRIDMSEYQHADSVGKMIGEGDNLGHLTEAVRNAPFSLVLLDEFEKAHPQILNLFLQVMDDGRLTDGQGRTIDFTNTIIIATSNAGALYIEEEILKGTDIATIKQSLVNEHLNKVMRPELINRFDGIIVFKPLTEGDIVSIANLLLKKIEKMLDAKGMKLEADAEGVKKLAKAGFDPKFGARPLRRVLQDRVENVVANKLLSGELERRDVVYINQEGEIEIRKARFL